MKYLKRLHGRRTPPGMEWTILKKLPTALVASTVIPLGVALMARVFPPPGSAEEVARRTSMVDILSIATGLTLWTAVFTVAIGCVIVHLMKGPAYVADAYPLNERADGDPGPGRRDNDQA
jgi:MFS family permease